jgi:surfeit locus 1 family protein
VSELKGRGKRFFLLALCALGLILFTGLGVWQVERRAWKLDLIERVNARVNAPPRPMPPRSSWPALDARDVEYRRVQLNGRFLHDHETLVDALTELGAGSWVLTPLVTPDGTVLVNRGFVPTGRRAQASRAEADTNATTQVTGLLRLSEPDGRVLRPNQPAADRWFSRDVSAIARKRGLEDVAPFFVDADVTSNTGGFPVGGLTVIRFRNTHLIYALTWFGLAALSLAGLVLLLKSPNKQT